MTKSTPRDGGRGRRLLRRSLVSGALVLLSASASVRAEPAIIPRGGDSIRIDGVLDEEAWRRALHVALAYEVDPGENVAAPVATDAYLAYDDQRLYVGFRAFDPEPSKIRGRFSDRDGASHDDYVGLVVDTFNDQRRALVFLVNALGVQSDLIQNDVGGDKDESWDAIWDSKGRVTESGYEVELAIPFSSLAFQQRDGSQVWGLDLIRNYPRDLSRTLASNKRDRNVSCYLCQLSKIEGFDGARPGRALEIVPTLVTGRTDVNHSFPDPELTAGDVESEVGVTAHWKARSNLGVSGTINPDFSQVEADVARLDVNEQFALFFPEKRPFFLEGSDLFETPIDAVYTRTVANPQWGGRVTGKEGRNAFGAILARDEPETDYTLLIPGSQDSSVASLEGGFDTAILRYRRDVADNSAIGVVATARDGEGYSNLVLGADMLLRVTDADTVEYHLLGSQTLYPDSIAAAYAQPQGRFEDRAIKLGYSHATRNWGTKVRYKDIGTDFRADLGFVPQVGIRNPEVGAWRTWWPTSQGGFSWIQLGGSWEQTDDQDGQLLDGATSLSLSATGPLQSYLSVSASAGKQVYRDIEFDQDAFSAFYQLAPQKDLYLGLGAHTKRKIDYAFEPDPSDPSAPPARDGREYGITPSLRYNFGRHLRFDLSHEYRRLEIDEGYLFRANLSELRLVQQFNLRCFVRAIVQYGDVARNRSLYPDCDDGDCDVKARKRDLFGQFLFSYKVNPRTALYLGLTESGKAETDTSLVTTERTYFLKLGYAWVP